jgi:hypothetical protein
MLGDISDSAVFCADSYRRCGGVAYIIFWVPVTYTVCLFRPLYHLHKKKILEKKMFGRWIHKKGKSKPDKRCKGYKSQAKTNGARKRKKK